MQNYSPWQALKFPFQPGNRINSLLIPCIPLTGCLVSLVLAQFLGFWLLKIDFHHAPMPWDKKVGLSLLDMASQLFFAPWIVGYYWECIATWRVDGYDAPTPSWGGKLLVYWKNGIKVIILNIALQCPVMILYYYLLTVNDLLAALTMQIMSIFLTGPLAMAAIVQASGTKQLSDLFHWQQTISALRQGYGRVIISHIIIMLCVFISFPLWILLSCTLIGIPLMYAYLLMVTFHLLTQAFDPYRPDA